MESERRLKIVYLESTSMGEDVSLEPLREFGDLTLYPVLDEAKTAERIADADIVLMNKTPMNEGTLKDASRLKLICEMATGYDNIDIPYCRKRGIAVVNAGHYSTGAVAQHTFALALSLLGKIGYYDDYVKSGAYSAQSKFTVYDQPIIELAGKTWGIAGMGEIGRTVAKIAEAFGAHVVTYSTSGRKSASRWPSLSFDEFLVQCDILSVHCPLTERTHHLFDEEAFAKMKRSAILINVARGKIVDQEALYRALIDEKISAAGLDVFEEEPMRADNPLGLIKDSRKLILTPHCAWASVEARTRDLTTTCENIRSFLSGGTQNRVDIIFT